MDPTPNFVSTGNECDDLNNLRLLSVIELVNLQDTSEYLNNLITKNFWYNIEDIHGKIIKLEGVNKNNCWIYESLKEFGSIDIYVYAQPHEKNYLRQNGFDLSLSQIIIHQAEDHFYGDIFSVRLQIVLLTLCNNIIVKPNVEGYKFYSLETTDLCLKELSFENGFSEYNYILWMSSCEDLATHSKNSFTLKCKLKCEEKESVIIIKDVLPRLSYEIKDNILCIPLDSISEIYLIKKLYKY